MPTALPKPTATASRVEDLVALVMAGQIRIPFFQRGLKWDSKDVIALFESIYLGYPVGSLLFHRRAATAVLVKLGPLKIHAPESEAALWVVDGQQRLAALAASFKRPKPVPTTPDDPWVVYFDAQNKRFCAPPDDGKVPDTWAPVPELLDASALSEWIFAWPNAHDPDLRKAIFDAGARLREYTIPSYTVETDQDQVLQEIFLRVNKFGKSLKWQEIHDALYGSQKEPSAPPSRLGELADELAVLGMGKPDEEDQLLRCLIAFEGFDVTRNFEELRRAKPGFLEGTAAAALPTLRRVLGFLQADAGIPHLRMLPWSAPLTILTRLFRFHPEPSSRSRELLARWLWRSILTARHYDDRTFQRRGVSGVDEHDEEASVQTLLDLIPTLPQPPQYRLPDRFDARSADSRIVLLGLHSLEPRDLRTGRPIDVPALIEAANDKAFRKIVGASVELSSSPANRALLPGAGLARVDLLECVGGSNSLFPAVNRESLRSHAISDAGALALERGDLDAFLQERAQTIEDQVATYTSQMADWDANDRPSIDYLLSHGTRSPSHGTKL
ncbi:DUF262 domain-containing protein [Enhygromyxa salina]|uniref:GmrSD restriction endonucleases N-terminal domain-containing protein n=1 Tax=Enhygromyxa salina TaxID=215803 RepID=A0A2S9YM19_9BACT|nr:DUF262 domain-containing protein [Enhygromyxa salina]PRQ06140.1 hypothetical protein ENSA7_41740 [Enhygromyxa salina]